MGNSLHFNGVDLSGSGYGLRVLRHGVRVVPGARVTVDNVAMRHGGISDGGWLEAREFLVSGVVQGTSASDLLSKLDAIKRVMDPSLGDKSIRFDYQSDRYFMGRLSGGIQAEFQGAAALVELSLVCADPLGRAVTATSIEKTIDENPEEWSTGSIPGTTFLPAVWTFSVSGATVGAWVIENTTTGDLISFAQSVAAGQQVRVDSERQIVEFSSDGGTSWVPAMSGIASLWNWPRLAPGVNALSVQAGAGAALVISGRGRYL